MRAILFKEGVISLDLANYSEILHRAHLGNNPIHTAGFFKFRSKFFFLKVLFLLNQNIFVINCYLQLCMYFACCISVRI